jgi:enamine deaminase RidA (YjgF/YER057c/UK114 family)
LRITERALQRAGASLHNVERARMYVTHFRHAEAVIRAPRGMFQNTRPASTLVTVTRSTDLAMLVEIEAGAISG